MPYVASTLSNDQCITQWEKPISEGGKIARPALGLKRVLINGKANVHNKILTPEGVLTKISEEDAEFLKGHATFQGFQKGGYMKIIAREADPAKVAKDMTTRDESAPLSVDHGDFKPGGRAAGVTPGVQKII